MSRSYRKRPFIGLTCAESEKDDKRKCNRAQRRIHNTKIHTAVEDDDIILDDRREVRNIYSFAKDGKQRIDPVKHNKEMRK